jgi:ABC-2 type transport system permease protein
MKLLHVILKDLQLATRPRTALGALLALPLVVILVVVGVESGDATRILLPVVNEDQGAVAAALCGVLREYLDVRQLDRPAALRLVAVENAAPAVLILPAGFSRRFRAAQPSTLELLTDPARGQELEAVRVLLLLADRKLANFEDPFAQDLLHLQERSVTTEQADLPRLEQRVPGLTVTFVLLSMVMSIALTAHDESANSINARLLAAPVSRTLLLSGRALAWVLVGTVQVLVLLVVGHAVYGLRLGNSPLALPLVVVCSVFAMAGFALAIATTARSREQVVPISLAAVFAVAMIGGCWWPSFKLPQLLQLAGRGTMTWWSMAAMHDVILRNRTVLAVAPKLVVLLGQGLMWWAVALALSRRAEGCRAGYNP